MIAMSWSSKGSVNVAVHFETQGIHSLTSKGNIAHISCFEWAESAAFARRSHRESCGPCLIGRLLDHDSLHVCQPLGARLEVEDAPHRHAATAARPGRYAPLLESLTYSCLMPQPDLALATPTHRRVAYLLDVPRATEE